METAESRFQTLDPPLGFCLFSPSEAEFNTAVGTRREMVNRSRFGIQRILHPSVSSTSEASVTGEGSAGSAVSGGLKNPPETGSSHSVEEPGPKTEP